MIGMTAPSPDILCPELATLGALLISSAVGRTVSAWYPVYPAGGPPNEKLAHYERPLSTAVVLSHCSYDTVSPLMVIELPGAGM